MTAPTTTAQPAYTNDFDREPARAIPPNERDWSLAQLLGFRFLLVYVLLYTFPGPIDELPGTGWIARATNALTHAVVPWFGAHVLRLAHPINLQPSGSGDRLFNWVEVALQLVVAAIVAGAWTAAARRTRSHPRLFAAFHLYVRFTLAAILLGYGFDKVFPNQFESINPVRLTQYIGEAAPGGFAWFFLGFSAPYVIFAGAGETLAGFLLFFRRTTTLGAVVGGAVLTNVFAINMAYDIPVKQFSLHLLLMCCFLVACDAQRMLNVFVRNRATVPRDETPLFATPKARRLAMATAVALVAWIVGSHVVFEYKALRNFGRLAPHSQLWGIYEMQDVVKNGAAQPPLLTDRTLWRRLSMTNRGMSVRFATDSLARFGVQVDSVAHTMKFSGAPPSKPTSLAYAFPDPEHLVLAGQLNGDSVVMRFTRRSMDSYLLVNRGFHWVNETPYFR